MLIKEIERTWSAGFTLTVAERWQCRKGSVLLTFEAVSDDDQGFVLNAAFGDTMDIPAGRTVRYRSVVGSFSEINREPLA